MGGKSVGLQLASRSPPTGRKHLFFALVNVAEVDFGLETPMRNHLSWQRLQHHDFLATESANRTADPCSEQLCHVHLAGHPPAISESAWTPSRSLHSLRTEDTSGTPKNDCPVLGLLGHFNPGVGRWEKLTVLSSSVRVSLKQCA